MISVLEIELITIFVAAVWGLGKIIRKMHDSGRVQYTPDSYQPLKEHHHWYTDPTWRILPGNIFHHDDNHRNDPPQPPLW